MSQDVNARIQGLIDANPVFVFMKGTPTFPQCGFSATVVAILDHLGVEYESTNILEDPELRQGIKDFSNWPTIPQIYVKGEFLGGCDIAKEMFQSGELKQLLEEKGVLEAA
ncbi:MAG: Grx4 family monothiol glutaredoxin [Alphaproteobacteria bacterium]|nr:Grx4 family monothiol glutaredoxin [Alphaproteobacteria bacterium]